MNQNLIYYIADLHIPYENKPAVRKALEEIAKERPVKVVLGGDIVDFYAISHFRKDPARANQLQSELNQYHNFMKKLRTVHKGALIYIIGNHERRMEKYLMENPELYTLDVLKIENILGKDKYNMFITYEHQHHGFMFKHGTAVNQYNANKELVKYGVSGISGHKHNHNVASRTDRNGSHILISSPCLCDFTQADYVHDPNWQTGFVKLIFKNKKLDNYQVKLL